MMDQKLLEYRIAALEYLDQTGTLEDIKRTCRTLGAQTEKKHAVFRFCIPVEPEDVLDLNASFGNFILNKPSGACKIFQSVIFRAIQVLELLPQCSDASQVMVVLRPLSLPRLEKYFISSTKDFPNHSEGQRLYMYEGIVTGKTIATKYTQSARFYCPIEGCDGGLGNRYIRLHTSGAREIHTIRKDFKCSFCGSPLEEDVSERVLADKVIIEMMDEQAFQYSQYISDMMRSTRFQALSVYIRDELSQDIQIGRKYTLIGIPTYEFQENNQVNVALEASNMHVAQNLPWPAGSPNLDSHLIPEQILQLYLDRNNSPWSFALSLAYVFGGTITPPGSYLRLKLGLLLCLMWGEDLDKQSSLPSRLCLLAIGSDTLILDRLMTYATTFPSRAIHHSKEKTLLGAVNKDRYGVDTYFIDGGSLLLTGDGVCYLGDMGRFNKATKEALQQVLDNNTVAVTIPSKSGGSIPQQVTFPLNCSVWAYAEPSRHLNPPVITDQLYVQKDMGCINKSLADVFGMVFFTDSTDSESYADNLIISHTLVSAMEPKSSSVPLISNEEMRQFVQYVRGQVVTCTTAADKLLCGYYVASRRVRSSSVQGTDFPVTAMKTLTSLSKAHAKLSLRREVTPEDAVMAILLYEEYITDRCGCSVLNVQPLRHCRNQDIGTYIGPQNDSQMKHFHTQLLRFCAAHAGDIEMGSTEE